MQRYMTFHAPWSRKLGYSTLLLILILFGASTLGRMTIHHGDLLAAFMVTGVPLLLAGSSSLFVIRGYIITEESLFVQRLFWNTRIDLNTLSSCEVNPAAMAYSLRTFGNGGMFCIAGYFRNKTLGNYRALATDPKLSVVLRFSDKIIVVTPDNPEQFAAALREIAKGSTHSQS